MFEATQSEEWTGGRLPVKVSLSSESDALVFVSAGVVAVALFGGLEAPLSCVIVAA